MATNKGSRNGTTRRGFIGAIGAVTASAAVPPLRTQAAAPATWAAWKAALPALRAAYRDEIARFAETLRPRFESGELRAAVDEDPGTGYRGGGSPMSRVERRCVEHFGLEVTETSRGEWIDVEGDAAGACLILAASPSTDETGGEPFDHAAQWAAAAAMWDVIFYARERGWYVPGPDEQLGRSYREEQEMRAAGVVLPEGLAS